MRVAKQHAQRYGEQYRVNAEEFRKQAARSSFPEIQALLLRIAASNERLCSIVEGTGDVAELESRAEPREPAKPSHEGAIKNAPKTRSHRLADMSRRRKPASSGRKPLSRGYQMTASTLPSPVRQGKYFAP